MRIILAIICAAFIAFVFTAVTRHRVDTFEARWPSFKARWDNMPMGGDIEDRRD